MIDVIETLNIAKILAIFSPMTKNGSETGLVGELTIKCLFFSKTGKDDFGSLSTEFTLYANQSVFPIQPKNGDYFTLKFDKYEIINTVLNDNNLQIKPFFVFNLAKKTL